MPPLKKSRPSHRSSGSSTPHRHSRPATGSKTPNLETSDAEDFADASGHSDLENTQPASQRGTKGKTRRRVRTVTPAPRLATAGTAMLGESHTGHWSADCGLDESGQDHVMHAFVQIMMHRQILRQDEAATAGDHTAMSVFREISGNTSGSVTALVAFIANVNENIKFLEIEIRRMLFPVEQAWYVALVNTTEDGPSELLVAPIKDAPDELYNHAELAFFKALVEAIATSDESVQAGVPVLSLTEALNLSYSSTSASQGGPSQGTQSFGKVLTMSEKQDLLSRLTHDRWLARDPNGRGGILGPRTLMALRPWVRSLDVSEETRQEWDRTL